jgi:Mg-chelatase subunit ChlI
VSAESVRIGTAILPRRVGEPGETTAKTERPPLCIDDETAATLDHVARAVILREPCLLEGETGTSKTSSIVWLAEQLRVPLARLNLHGQTDSGELVGRHLPARDGGWRWQEGLLLQAMRQGSWVLLDELNLAETDVLERIDSLLERAPTLVVSEHDLERFGDGGTPIHRDFRLFATMNPVGYAGRNRLSPAFLDRFRARRYVAGPDEHAYESLLRALVLGQQPSVVLDGRRWNEGELLAPPWARLAAFGQIEELLELLARLHASVVAAAANGDRGDVPKPTRRALLSVLDYLDQWHSAPPLSAEVVVEAVRRTYLAPLPPGPHRDAVAALLDAAGFEQLLRSFERTVATGEARLAEADADACHAEDSNEEAEATP